MSNRASLRSTTGNHVLQPASRPGLAFEPVPRVPTYSLITWTFGRGSVIWRIWPAVLLHTVFAAAIVTLSVRGIMHLEIPNIMLTVLGVVIGFVISYRAMSGYERYWLGRGCWSDIIRNSRTFSRLIWYHVPPRLTPKTPEEIQSGQVERPIPEMNKVMAEKRMALDMIHGFAVAIKHHLRGELGIYFEDLYHLVRPLHDHVHTADEDAARSTAVAPPRKGMRITTHTNLPPHHESVPISTITASPRSSYSFSPQASPQGQEEPSSTQYGTFGGIEGVRIADTSRLRKPSSNNSLSSAVSNVSSPSQPLLPSSQPPADEVMNKVSGDLIPFARSWKIMNAWFTSEEQELPIAGHREVEQGVANNAFLVQRKWQGPVQTALHMKHRPKVAGGGENLPVEIIRCLSEWVSVLEDRNTVSGPTLGNMIGNLAAFEDTLTGLERILTTPLPFVYSVHIRTVWLYLFFLPFQLVTQFGYYTIPGVAIASFIYLGFVAAGEEIEQPFGYDDNDLDLELFCQDIIGADIKHIKRSPGLNAYLGALHEHPQTVHRRSMTLDEITNNHSEQDAPITPIGY